VSWAEAMPRYYFDFRDGDHSTTDEDGINLASLEAARDEAARALGSGPIKRFEQTAVS
jgi:hypothetical protein